MAKAFHIDVFQLFFAVFDLNDKIIDIEIVKK